MASATPPSPVTNAGQKPASDLGLTTEATSATPTVIAASTAAAWAMTDGDHAHSYSGQWATSQAALSPNAVAAK